MVHAIFTILERQSAMLAVNLPDPCVQRHARLSYYYYSIVAAKFKLQRYYCAVPYTVLLV